MKKNSRCGFIFLIASLLPQAVWGLPSLTGGSGATQINQIVNEADLKDHATPLCTQPSGSTCQTNVCVEVYLNCAFGPSNQNGCSEGDTSASSGGSFGFTVQLQPGQHTCQKSPVDIQTTCDASLDTFLSRANTACEPLQNGTTSPPVAENNSTSPMPSAGGCSLVNVPNPLSPFHFTLILSAVFVPFVLRLRKK